MCKKELLQNSMVFVFTLFSQRRRRKINGTTSTECVESSIKNDLADAISTPFSKAVYNLQNQSGFCSEYEIASILQGPLLFFAIVLFALPTRNIEVKMLLTIFMAH